MRHLVVETAHPKSKDINTSGELPMPGFSAKTWQLEHVERRFTDMKTAQTVEKQKPVWSFIENAHSGGPGLQKQSQAPQIQEALRRDSKAVLWSPRKPLHLPYGRVLLFGKESQTHNAPEESQLVVVKLNSCPVKICSVKRVVAALRCGCCFFYWGSEWDRSGFCWLNYCRRSCWIGRG